jgi:hypothetical protein
MKLLVPVLFLVLCTASHPWAAPTDAPADEATLKRATAFFHASTFGRLRENANRRLHKWSGPLKVITIVSDEKVAQDLGDDTDAALDTISRLTGIEMAPTNDLREANFHIIFTKTADFSDVLTAFGIADHRGTDAMKRDNACLGLPSVRRSGPTGIFSHGVVLVGTDREPGPRRACLWRSLFQAMGLFAPKCRYGPSVYCSDKSAARRPTPIDRLLMAVLYDERLPPGMPETEAMALVPNLLQQHWRTYMPVTN